MSPKEAFGFKLMINHIGYQGFRDAKQFIAMLNTSGYTIIKLSRRNLFRSAISLLYAQETGKFHHNDSEKPHVLSTITLDPTLFIQKFSWLQQLANQQNQVTATIPHLELIYEEHLQNLKDHQATVDLVTGYLGLPHAEVHSNFTRMPTEDYSEYVSNLDEILMALHNLESVNSID